MIRGMALMRLVLRCFVRYLASQLETTLNNCSLWGLDARDLGFTVSLTQLAGNYPRFGFMPLFCGQTPLGDTLPPWLNPVGAPWVTFGCGGASSRFAPTRYVALAKDRVVDVEE